MGRVFTSDGSYVNQCFIPCEFFIGFFICLQNNAESMAFGFFALFTLDS